jgi:hypothetical protein
MAGSIPITQGLIAASQKTMSDDIAVENMLAPSHIQVSQAATDNSLLNPAQRCEGMNQPIVSNTGQNIPAAECSEEASSVRPDYNMPLLPTEDSNTSNVSAQRAILSNIQNTGQPQQSVPKVTGKIISHRNDIPDICIQDTDSGHFQDISSVLQSQVQSNVGHLESNRLLVPDDTEHVQIEQNTLKCAESVVQNNIQNDQSLMQSSLIGGSFGLVTNNAEVNGSQNQVPSILGIPTSVQMNVTSLGHMNRGKMPHIPTFPASTDEPCRNTTSQINSYVSSTSTQQDQVVHNKVSNDLPSINNLSVNTSIGQKSFNLIDFISNNSPQRAAAVLHTDLSSTQGAMDILANKTAQDGQTALLENIMGYTVPNTEPVTLPLTPKGACGSGYGLGLDVDEFLNSEDGQRM